MLPVLGSVLSTSAATSFAVAVVAYLAEAATTIVGRVLIALGFGLVTVTGMTAALNSVIALGSTSALGNPVIASALSSSGMTWFLSTIYSALTVRLTLKGLSSDSVSFWVMRKRTSGAGLPTGSPDPWVG